MRVNLVFVHVKIEKIADFKSASLRNASESRKEHGIAQFDIIQEIENPARFIFIEVFNNEEAAAKHKETTHYKEWKEAVEPMMAEERRSIKCISIDPSSPKGVT